MRLYYILLDKMVQIVVIIISFAPTDDTCAVFVLTVDLVP